MGAAPWKNAKAAVRKQFLSSIAEYGSADVLEIGAFASPTLTKTEARVTYLDRLSTQALRNSVQDAAKREAIVPVDFVQTGDTFPAELHGRFDIVIANHVVEHVPNLIGWLEQIRLLLRPGAVLAMAVPDRDYTFDKLRELTTLREILTAYFEGRTSPSLASIVDQQYFSRPITTGRQVWSGAYREVIDNKKHPTLKEAIAQARRMTSQSGYVDCHCNVFTRDSFVKIVKELCLAGLIRLDLETSKAPQRPYNEFYVAFRNRERATVKDLPLTGVV